MADFDINQPGFFHLCRDIQREESSKTSPKLQYWKKRQAYLLRFLEKNSVPLPQANAIKNTTGVFMFLIKSQKHKAKDYFAELHKDCPNQEINTIANYHYVCNVPPNTDEEANLQDLENSTALEKATALCERGYFQLYMYDEHIQTLEQAQYAVNFLEAGIREGSGQGMSQVELCVWKYYLSDATRKAFDFTVAQNYSRDTQIDAFHRMVTCFHDFYSVASEDCAFYKSRAVADIILTITTHEDVAVALPNFKTLCEESILGDLWEDRLVSVEEALQMSPKDYRVPARIAKIYCRQDKFKDAIKFTDVSLDIESEICCSAKHTRVIAYAHMGKAATLEGNDQEGDECLQLAYEEGKKVKDEIMSSSCAAEMAKVCYHLSIDKSAKPVWTVRRDRAKYFDEAIAYNNKAIDAFPIQPRPRANRLLSDCYWTGNRYEESFECLRKALEFNLPDLYISNFKSMLYRYRQFLYMKKIEDHKKEEIIGQIAEDLLKAWNTLKFTSMEEKFRDYFVFFINKISGFRKWATSILKEISMKDVSDGKVVLKGYCQWLQQSDDTKEWLKDFCADIRN